VINIKSEKWWTEFIFLIEGYKFAGVEKKEIEDYLREQTKIRT